MITGRAYTARELYREAAKDAAFYRKGGGGVTLSGGEVLLQWEVASETLRLCRTNYINTCIETSAFAPWAHLWQVAQYCHTVFVDLKHMDSEKAPGADRGAQQADPGKHRMLCQALPPAGGGSLCACP